jgi:hypothetical protein
MVDAQAGRTAFDRSFLVLFLLYTGVARQVLNTWIAIIFIDTRCP